MSAIRRLAVVACAAIGAGTALAQESGALQIYQQRTADGRIVLSDRLQPGAQTQRSWQFTPEDPAAAQQRREVARREAEAISERIQRQLDREQQRAEEIALERLRLAQAQAQRDAESARYDTQYYPTVGWYWPHRVPPHFKPPHIRPPHIVPPFPSPRPPRVPRPGPPEPRMKDAPLTAVVAPARS